MPRNAPEDGRGHGVSGLTRLRLLWTRAVDLQLLFCTLSAVGAGVAREAGGLSPSSVGGGRNSAPGPLSALQR